MVYYNNHAALQNSEHAFKTNCSKIERFTKKCITDLNNLTRRSLQEGHDDFLIEGLLNLARDCRNYTTEMKHIDRHAYITKLAVLHKMIDRDVPSVYYTDGDFSYREPHDDKTPYDIILELKTAFDKISFSPYYGLNDSIGSLEHFLDNYEITNCGGSSYGFIYLIKRFISPARRLIYNFITTNSCCELERCLNVIKRGLDNELKHYIRRDKRGADSFFYDGRAHDSVYPERKVKLFKSNFIAMCKDLSKNDRPAPSCKEFLKIHDDLIWVKDMGAASFSFASTINEPSNTGGIFNGFPDVKIIKEKGIASESRKYDSATEIKSDQTVAKSSTDTAPPKKIPFTATTASQTASLVAIGVMLDRSNDDKQFFETITSSGKFHKICLRDLGKGHVRISIAKNPSAKDCELSMSPSGTVTTSTQYIQLLQKLLITTCNDFLKDFSLIDIEDSVEDGVDAYTLIFKFNTLK
jgi:hypothetical protein